MLKRIFGSKPMPALSFVILLIFCLCVVFLVSSLLGSKAPEQAQSRYKIGETVVDSGGSLWEYLGNFRIELGQITKDMELLSVFICNVEKQVLFVHEELIPDTTIGDLFKLIEASPQLSAQMGREIGILSMPYEDYCNFSVSDPPSFSPMAAGVVGCCVMIYCGD